jgi:hypothetical protein
MLQPKDLSRKGCRGSECQIRGKAVVVHLLRLVYEVSGIEDRVIGLQ